MFFSRHKKHQEYQYLNILSNIIKNGTERIGRNASTKSLFAQQIRFDLKKGFPAMTTKKLAFSSVVSELLWFIKGPTKNDRMDDNELKKISGKDKTIWTANANADYWIDKAQFEGDLGRVYGCQWRDWRGPQNKKVDQLQNLISTLKTNPYDRRLVISAWNPGEIDDMALPPCHMIFQFFVDSKNNLSIHMLQRSCDMFLGVPFNIASYALLVSMVAQCVGMNVGECILTLNDAHIYDSHIEQVQTQLKRKPFNLPTLWLNPEIKNIDDFKMDDIKLKNYKSHDSIFAKMIV